ncbi:MAG: hypothetical protein P8Q41_09850 [Saprospiraceae bacterium]|jgi:ABC-type transporter Mla MlaB component|nr:hypothetical protein [Saprospiraceae bacterium]MDG1434304.1 hypothetical protein [Saprospiraceae bacterium]
MLNITFLYSKIILSLSILWIAAAVSLNAQITPLPQAHSHNDYFRNKPLKDALRHGFTSVEADVLYIYGKLVVGHDMPNRSFPRLKPLNRQYLKPLWRRWKRCGKEIYKDYEGVFYLWIDIKSYPNQTYRELRDLLFPFREMLNYYEKGKFHEGKVTVILSGDRPFEALQQDSLQLMTLDGRLSDLEKNYPSYLMPFISENAGKVAQVEDYSQVDAAALLRISSFIRRIHDQGKKARLWATPEDENLWIKLLEMEIDLINTDKLSKLQKFLLKKK